MAENGVSFKVFVRQGEDDKPEVRRFTIDRSVVTNFEYMRAKLQNVFPSLKNSAFSVSWRDEEGDEITISTDDELMVALASIQDDLKKLYIDLNDSVINEGPMEALEAMEIPEFSPIHSQCEHVGVVCDSCNGPIVGYRYKCVSCEDFDLCPTCEGANKHSQHFMIRIPLPISPMKRRFSRNISHSLFKSLRKGGAFDGSSAGECLMNKRHCKERTSECRRAKYEGRCGTRTDKRREGSSEEKTHAHEAHPRCARRNGGGWLNTVATYMNEFANLAGDLNLTPVATPAAANATNQATNTQTGTGTSANTSTSTTAGSGTENTTASDHEKIYEIQRMYLQNIGKTVAKILDPLGIDVDIDVRPKSGSEQPTNGTQNASAPTEQPHQMPSTSVPISNLIQSQQETTLIDVDDDMSEKSISRDKSGTPERIEGWTILNTEGPEPILPPNPPAGNIGFDFEKMTRDFQQQMQMLQSQHLASHTENVPASSANIYPNIPAHMSQPTAPVQVTQAPKEVTFATPVAVPRVAPEPEYRPADPKIAAALDTMLAMGFKNDGGRLARLIEKKNGNISSVLDILSMNIP